MPFLSNRFMDALNYSFQLHRDQVRKASGVPYYSHIMSTAALVIENGGDEDEAIAGLLHDAVEDQGGLPILLEIKKLFGERVAAIVEGCSDAYEKPKPPWRSRKEEYLAKLSNTGKDVRLVSLADKLHNARCLLELLRNEGENSWVKFNGGKEGTLWYYEALVDIFQNSDLNPMVEELVRVVNEIRNISGYTRD